MQKLEGLFAPLVSTFTDDGSTVSEVRFARQIRFLMEAGVDGFVVCSETGEFTTLGQSERKGIVELLMRGGGGKPVLVHVSTLSTSSSLDLAQHAARHGARAGILMPPFFGTYTADEVISFFRPIVKRGDLPIIAVDPQQLLTDEIREALRDLPDLVFATPLNNLLQGDSTSGKGLSDSDEFIVQAAVTSPLALLRPNMMRAAVAGSEVDLAKLVILEETLGRARVSKAGLEALGLEVGPPRPPLKPLTGMVVQALKTLLAPQDA